MKEEKTMTIKEVIEQAKKRYNMDITEEQAKKWLDAHPDVEQLTDEELDNVTGGLTILGERPRGGVC